VCRTRVSGPRGAAVKLGIPRSTLESKIQRLRIAKYYFKSEARASGGTNCTTFACSLLAHLGCGVWRCRSPIDSIARLIKRSHQR
jgi:hypothetical protein